LFMLLERAMGRQVHSSSPKPLEEEPDLRETRPGSSAGGLRQGQQAGTERQPQATLQRASAASEAVADLDLFYKRRLSGNFKLMRAAPGVILEVGMAAEKMITVSHRIAQDCLHSDALAALRESSKHMQNAQYISGHIMSNGQDIVEELADAMLAYKARDFKKFGSDFGTAMRKVFLCKADGSGMPEGRPDEAVVANVTEGLLEGFFGEGSQLSISFPGGSTIPIDLHQCIANNLGTFTSVWSEIMFLYAKKVAGTKAKDKEQLEWSTAVAFTMMKIPGALEKCSLGPEEQQMLQEAIAGLASGRQGGLGWDFQMPGSTRVSSEQLEEHLAITIKAWAEQRWMTFGQDLGRLLQEMVLTVFAKKYTLDSDGLLQTSLLGRSVVPPNSVAGFLTLVAAASAVLGLVAMRRARSARGLQVSMEAEGFSDQEAAE